jgi:isoquinoline 1-oxidoreductase subunit alpha
MTKLTVNDRLIDTDAAPDTPVLWVLRDHLGMTGTKFGCGMALCGACTVHLDGAAVRSCVLPLGAVAGREITTIEGLSADRSHVVQKAWLEIDVPQCGYCQSGQIMSAAALLHRNPNPSDAEIDAAMSGNLCRCGTYPRIRKAIRRAMELQGAGGARGTGAVQGAGGGSGEGVRK